MNVTITERHQASRLVDYKDQISSSVFQMYRILTTYFPDQNIKPILDMQNILDNDIKNIINNLSNK